jgi:hypothetical protein
MRRTTILIFALFLLIGSLSRRFAIAQQEHHDHALRHEEVGSVQFSTSCAQNLAEHLANKAIGQARTPFFAWEVILPRNIP